MKTPPGLHCLGCHQPFNGEILARATDEGLIHVPSCLAGDGPQHMRDRGPYRRHKPRQSTADFLEDVEFMANTGESLSGAARRLGRKPEALATKLQRLGRLDIARTLRSREGDWNCKSRMRETA